ncbi:MAG: SH3 domain-containing protein, partial [Myxococcota bacterium]
AIAEAVGKGAKKAADRKSFLDILAQAIVDTYVREEPLLHYGKAKRRLERKKKRKLTDKEDSELLDKYKKRYEPIGKRKGTNIVTKIPRTLKLPDVSKKGEGATAAGTVAGAAAGAMASAAASAALDSTGDSQSAGSDDAMLDAALRGPSASEACVADTGHDSPGGQAGAALSESSDSEQCWQTPVAMEVVASRLHVRSEPSARRRDSILGSLAQGQRISVQGRSGAWLLIEYQGQWAYVNGGHVRAVAGSGEAEAGSGMAEDVTRFVYQMFGLGSLLPGAEAAGAR